MTVQREVSSEAANTEIGNEPHEVSWQERYLDRFYYRRPDWIDGTTEFHNLCASVIAPNAEILEIGAGPSNRTSRFLATLGNLHGIDPDKDIRTNDALIAAYVLTGDRYPFPDGSFEACVSNYVIEHIADPAAHLKEVWRVLKNNGVYIFRTPNLMHYTSIVSLLTPHWFHKLVANHLRNLPADAHEPYPTLYRLNSAGRIRSHAADRQFSIAELRMVEKEPSYGLSSRLTFLGFMCYERAVNRFNPLAGARSNIFGVLKKQVISS